MLATAININIVCKRYTSNLLLLCNYKHVSIPPRALNGSNTENMYKCDS